MPRSGGYNFKTKLMLEVLGDLLFQDYEREREVLIKKNDKNINNNDIK